MLNGGNSVLYMKQLDFLPLASDQIVNTCNFLRCAPAGPSGSFTIVVIVCDHGFQGPQSSFHDLAGLCAMGRVNGYMLTDRAAAEHIVSTQLAQPGFRILALSQRMFSTELLDVPVLYSAPDASLFQYTEGGAATIVCFGFSVPAGLALARRFAEQNSPAAVFSVHPVLPHRWHPVVESAARTRRVIALDDAKGPCSLAQKLLHQVAQAVPGCRTTAVTREENVDFRVSADCFEPDLEALAEQCYSLSS